MSYLDQHFSWPHLDYGDTIYDQTFNEYFQTKMKSLQYNAAVPTPSAIPRSSTGKEIIKSLAYNL